MSKFKKILNIAVWVLLVSGLIVLLGFVDKAQDSLACKSLDIQVAQDDENFFIDKNDVRQLLRDRGDTVIGQNIATFNVPEIEHVLASHSAIDKAEVFVTVNGDVKVKVSQRKPVVRVFNKTGESYYLDEAGTLMPLSDKFTSRVLVVTGNLLEPYASFYKYSIVQIQENEELKAKTMLDEVFEMANYIRKDDFLSSQVVQLYVNNDNEFELVPRVGDHRIIFGDVSDMDEKFKKLLIFYREGLATTGWWNNYSVINLKYKNQVVCVRKEQEPKS